jgi:hypothetical protein
MGKTLIPSKSNENRYKMIDDETGELLGQCHALSVADAKTKLESPDANVVTDGVQRMDALEKLQEWATKNPEVYNGRIKEVS